MAQFRDYYSNFEDFKYVYNLHYLGNNDYNDSDFIGSFTTFQNLVNHVKNEHQNVNYNDPFEQPMFMVIVSHINGNACHKSYYRLSGINKLENDNAFKDKDL